MPKTTQTRQRRISKTPQPRPLREIRKSPLEPEIVPIFKRQWFLALVLAIIAFGVYSPVLQHPFVNFDDQSYIVENSRVSSGLSWSTVRWALTATEEANWHPVTWISHALDCQMFGLNAAGHHATNAILHAANAALLFLLLFVATGLRWRSLAVAALFALHPLNVESVAWAAERKNVLSMFFLLLTLAAYGLYVRKPGIARYLPVVLLFVFALASKPMVVTLPCALLLLDYWPLRRAQSSDTSENRRIPQRSWSQLALEKVPLLALSAASSVITIYAQRLSMPTTEALPFSQRLGNAIYSYAAYLWKTFWPSRLAVFYPHEGANLAAWRVGLSVVVLAGISVWVWSQRRSRSYLLIGWLWFLGNLVPVIGIVQVGDQGMADRYLYLPLIGILVMVVWGIADVTAEKLRCSRDVVLAVSVGIACAVLAVLTLRQLDTWRSSNDLWSHALTVTSNNYLAEDYIGSALLVEAYETTGQRYSDEATVHFRNAVRINPHDVIGHLNVGADFHEHGRLNEAIDQYTEVLQSTSDEHLRAKAYIALGSAYGQLHRFDEAEQSYRMAMQLEPGNQGLLMHLGQLGMEERIAELSKDAVAHPAVQTYVVLGQLQQSVGRIDEARGSFERALKLDPKSKDARGALESISH